MRGLPEEAEDAVVEPLRSQNETSKDRNRRRYGPRKVRWSKPGREHHYPNGDGERDGC